MNNRLHYFTYLYRCISSYDWNKILSNIIDISDTNPHYPRDNHLLLLQNDGLLNQAWCKGIHLPIYTKYSSQKMCCEKFREINYFIPYSTFAFAATSSHPFHVISMIAVNWLLTVATALQKSTKDCSSSSLKFSILY